MLPCGAPERLIIFSLNELSLLSVAKLGVFPGTTNKKSKNFQCIFSFPTLPSKSLHLSSPLESPLKTKTRLQTYSSFLLPYSMMNFSMLPK